MAKLDSRFIDLIASDEEASAGLLEDKAVTPKQLKSIGRGIPSPATTEDAGIIRVADHTEAVVGANSDIVIVPSEMLPAIWNLMAKWTERTLPSSKSWSSVCWSPELRLFCSVAQNSNAAITSPDGITWTERTLTTTLNWYSVCWSPELGLFCAIAYSSNAAITSPDGITWTERTLPSSKSWSSVCWSPELRLFCAVAVNSNTVATSPDGITWIQKTLPSSKSWSSVCWSPELRLFCAVAGNSNTATIYGFN